MTICMGLISGPSNNAFPEVGREYLEATPTGCLSFFILLYRRGAARCCGGGVQRAEGVGVARPSPALPAVASSPCRISRRPQVPLVPPHRRSSGVEIHRELAAVHSFPGKWSLLRSSRSNQILVPPPPSTFSSLWRGTNRIPPSSLGFPIGAQQRRCCSLFSLICDARNFLPYFF